MIYSSKRRVPRLISPARLLFLLDRSFIRLFVLVMDMAHKRKNTDVVIDLDDQSSDATDDGSSFMSPPKKQRIGSDDEFQEEPRNRAASPLVIECLDVDALAEAGDDDDLDDVANLLSLQRTDDSDDEDNLRGIKHEPRHSDSATTCTDASSHPLADAAALSREYLEFALEPSPTSSPLSVQSRLDISRNLSPPRQEAFSSEERQHDAEYERQMQQRILEVYHDATSSLGGTSESNDDSEDRERASQLADLELEAVYEIEEPKHNADDDEDEDRLSANEHDQCDQEQEQDDTDVKADPENQLNEVVDEDQTSAGGCEQPASNLTRRTSWAAASRTCSLHHSLSLSLSLSCQCLTRYMEQRNNTGDRPNRILSPDEVARLEDDSNPGSRPSDALRGFETCTTASRLLELVEQLHQSHCSEIAIAAVYRYGSTNFRRSELTAEFTSSLSLTELFLGMALACPAWATPIFLPCVAPSSSEPLDATLLCAKELVFDFLQPIMYNPHICKVSYDWQELLKVLIHFLGIDGTCARYGSIAERICSDRLLCK